VEIISEAQRQAGVASCWMAAYDIFLRSALKSWIMQRCGAFSVDRDGNDRRSMKAASGILSAGEYALTIFPEGNVAFTNDRVSPFLDGAAFLALRAQKEVGPDTSIFVVPVSVKVTHLTDVRALLRRRFDDIAASVGTSIDPDQDFINQVTRVGVACLHEGLRRLDHPVPEAGVSDLPGLLDDTARGIIEDLESRLEVRTREGDNLVDRTRRVRQTIHRIRTDPEREAENKEAARRGEEALLALRILSYSGNYLHGSPSVDRVGEVSEKLMEDLHDELRPAYADRHAYVHFGEPLDLAQRLEAFREDSRGTVEAVTEEVERAVQAGLDRLAKANPHTGGETFIT
jgi:1-acyl-sn-glycerol-3-phosphate acyltransferase